MRASTSLDGGTPGWMALLLLCGLLLPGCATDAARSVKPLQAVPALDLERYLGKWYEIASYPNSFQRGCVATSATYSKLPDGEIRVFNECRQDRLEGPPRSIEGKAWLAGDGSDPAKLKVQFFWPFRANYWVIGLDPDYRWAMVGEPCRKYLWILSRTPTISNELYARLLERAREAGYDTNLLVRTPQPG